jgi:hypothetical protein
VRGSAGVPCVASSCLKQTNQINPANDESEGGVVRRVYLGPGGVLCVAFVKLNEPKKLDDQILATRREVSSDAICFLRM